MKSLLILFLLFFIIGGCTSIPSKDLKTIHEAIIECPDYWDYYQGDGKAYRLSLHRKCWIK